MRIAISACLLGIPARYDGGTKPCPAVISLAEEPGVEVVAVCPETAAGLPVPRPPAEHRDGRVVFADGVDATEAFERGSAVLTYPQTIIFIIFCNFFRCFACFKWPCPVYGFGFHFLIFIPSNKSFILHFII